jgi:hypothetical protein
MTKDFDYEVIADTIVYFKNVYKDLEYIVDSLSNFSHKPWTRHTGEVMGNLFEIDSKKDGASLLLYNAINILPECINQYCKINNKDQNMYTLYRNTIYFLYLWNTPQKGYESHYDLLNINDKKVTADFTLVQYFTDDYEGGKLQFPDLGISFKPVAGSVIVFPSTTIHSVTDVISGRRLISNSFAFNKQTLLDIQS